MPLIQIGTGALEDIEYEDDECEYNPSYAIPTSWLPNLPPPGDCPSAIHNAQQDLCYLIITEHSHAEPDVNPAASYVSNWAFMACTEAERLELGPIFEDEDFCVLDMFDLTEFKMETAVEELREICPEGDEVLLSKLWLHLWIAKEVSLYRDWVAFARCEVEQVYENTMVPDDTDGLGGKFVDYNGVPFFKPRYPVNFYCKNPEYHSWYTIESSDIHANETKPKEVVEAISTLAAGSMEPLETSGREILQETDEGLEIAMQRLETRDRASLVSGDGGIVSTDICDKNASPTQGLETGDQESLVSDDRGVGSTDICDEDASRPTPVSCEPPLNLDAMDIKDTAVVAEIREIWDDKDLHTAPVHGNDWEIV